jgi:TolA-binding protein
MRRVCAARMGSLLRALILTTATVLGSAAPAAAEEQADAATRQYAATVALQNRGLFDLAAEEWTKFLATYKGDAKADRALHYLGVCQLKTNKAEQAVATFQQVLKDYPKSEMTAATYLYLGVAQYTLARAGKPQLFDAAAGTFDALITKFPEAKDVPQAFFYRGECFYAQNKKKEAADAYATLVQKYPQHALAVDALYALGVAQEELGQPDAAGKTYDAFLAKFPANTLATEVTMRRGETLFAIGQFDAAAKWFAAAAAVKGFAMADHATFRQAAALAQLKQFGQAAPLYASIATKFPQSKYVGSANLAGGKCYYLAGSYDEARGLLDKVAGAGGDTAAEAAHWIARSLLRQKKAADALAAAERALPQGGAGAWGVQLLLDQADAIYEIPERRAQATGLYAALAAKYPKDPLAPQALYMAAFAAMGQGDYKGALTQTSGFLAQYPNNELAVDVTYVAAECNLQLAQYAEADKLYAQLVEKHSKHPDAPSWKIRRGLTLYLQKKYQETAAAVQPLLAEISNASLKAEACYLVGSSQVELKQVQEGVKSLQESLAADPKWRQADDTLLVLAHAYWLLGNAEEAKNTVRKLIAGFPESRLLDRAHFRLGEYLYAGQDFDGAAAEYQAVVDKWPASPAVPAALYGLGWSRLSQKQFAEAEAALDRLIEKAPQDKLIPRARYARGMARQQLGKFAPAIDDVQALLGADPTPVERSDARYVLGLCQAGLKKPAEAAATFQKLLQEDPQYAATDKVLYELAWAQTSLGQEKLAAESFARIARDFTKSPLAAEAGYHVGEYSFKQEDFGRAAAAYYESMKMAGKTPLGEKATYKLGWSYFRQNDFDNAAQTFRYQRVTWPDGPLAADALFMDAECLFKQDKFAEALAAYDQLKNLSSKEFEALALLHAAQAAGQLKQWTKSIELAAKCAQQYADSPYAPQAIYEQGWAQQSQDKLDEAIKLYETVIAKATNQEVAARAQYMIGEIQFQKKDHKEAIKSFYRVVAGYGYPRWQADAMYEAARCFEVLKMKDKAIEQYRELVEKHPQSDKAAMAKERIKVLGG